MTTRRRLLGACVGVLGVLTLSACSSVTTRRLSAAARELPGIAEVEITAYVSVLSQAKATLTLAPGLDAASIASVLTQFSDLCAAQDWAGDLVVHRTADGAIMTTVTTRPPQPDEVADWLAADDAVAGAVSASLPRSSTPPTTSSTPTTSTPITPSAPTPSSRETSPPRGMQLTVRTDDIAADLDRARTVSTRATTRWRFADTQSRNSCTVDAPGPEDPRRWRRLAEAAARPLAPVTEATWDVTWGHSEWRHELGVRVGDLTDPAAVDVPRLMPALLPLLTAAELTRASAARADLSLEVRLVHGRGRTESLGGWRSSSAVRRPGRLNDALSELLPLRG